MIEIQFAKVRQSATIPTKLPEDAGYDIYADLSDVNYIVIEPQETELIPTGLASAFDAEYGFILKERWSIGSKGIALRSSIVDSGYRGEWKIALTNTTNNPVIIKKDSYTGPIDPCAIVISDKEAIAQAVFIKLPLTTTVEVPYEQLKAIHSLRGIDASSNIG